MIESLEYLLAIARSEPAKPELRLKALDGAARFLLKRTRSYQQTLLESLDHKEEIRQYHDLLTELASIVTDVMRSDSIGLINAGRNPDRPYARSWNLTEYDKVHAHAMFLEWAHAYPTT